MSVQLHHGDAVKWAQEYEGEPFHALLCDAPYEMAFMNRGWDSSGVAFDPDTWRALARVLHPGAFLFVFAGTINDDLISVSMREAGLRKFHKVMGWANGAGFPKATRIDTQIDKQAGAEQKVIGTRKKTYMSGGDIGSHEGWSRPGHRNPDGTVKRFMEIKEPATPLAQAFAGHRYGLQALKPAIETVLIFQKPYAGRPIDSIVETGAGCLWVDGGRIGTGDNTGRPCGVERQVYGFTGKEMTTETHPQGRWPSNFYLGDEAAARRLDEQSGTLTSGKPLGKKHTDKGQRNTYGNFEGYEYEHTGFGDSGGASRFFFRVEEQIDAADPVHDFCCICSQKHGIMSETHNGDMPCETVKNAENNSSQSDLSKDFALTPVRENGRRKSGGKSAKSNLPVNNAAKSGQTTQAITEIIAAESAPASPEKQIAQNVKSVANLCDSCGMIIAQSLVLMQQDQDPALIHIPEYMPERKRRTLRHSLALTAAILAKSDITLIIQDLNMLSGFVNHVIESCTGGRKLEQPRFQFSNFVEKQIEDAEPVKYQAKSSRRERDAGLDEYWFEGDEISGGGGTESEKADAFQARKTGRRNPHPCLKPLALTRYLATLLLPPAEYAPRRLLVPFAGVCSEVIGGVQAGWEEVVGLEITEEYIPIGKARVDYWQSKEKQLEMGL